MTEFFLVTHEKDIVLDDSSINNKTGWTSEKIVKEIVENRITKFEELKDVDVTNKKDKQIVAYSADTGKFVTVNGVDAGEIIGSGLKQIDKLGIIGSKEKPRIVHIPINTLDFKVPKINVLKYDADNSNNLLMVKSDFTNGEANDFEKNEVIIFDGKAHLKTEYYTDFQFVNKLINKLEFSVPIKKPIYKDVISMENIQDGAKNALKTTAIPHDQLLIPKGDMNLSNVKKINSFNLIGQGKNVRIVCSANSGKTWNYFDKASTTWKKIDELNIKNVREKGMDIDLFNSINSEFWNLLITAKKVRFAYLLSMDNIDDIEELDKLEINYDAEGKWLQAKDAEYDVIYASNSILEVHLYFSGDVKINYAG